MHTRKSSPNELKESTWQVLEPLLLALAKRCTWQWINDILRSDPRVLESWKAARVISWSTRWEEERTQNIFSIRLRGRLQLLLQPIDLLLTLLMPVW